MIHLSLASELPLSIGKFRTHTGTSLAPNLSRLWVYKASSGKAIGLSHPKVVIVSPSPWE